MKKVTLTMPDDKPKSRKATKPRKRRTGKASGKNPFDKAMLKDAADKRGFLLLGCVLFGLGWLVHFRFEGLGVLLAWGGVLVLLWRGAAALKRRWGNPMAVVALGISAVVIVLLFTLFYQAAHIYADAGRQIASEYPLLDWSFLRNWAEAINGWPVIGNLLAPLLRFFAEMLESMSLNIFGLIGVLIFCVIQTLECLPRVIRSSPLAMKAMIEAFSKFQKLKPRGDESPVITKLYQEHNDYYESFLTGLDWARLGAYAIDFCVCLWAAPIIVGGYGVWNTVKFTFGFGDVAWANVVRICITLFFFEFTVWILINCFKALYFYSHLKGAKKNAV